MGIAERVAAFIDRYQTGALAALVARMQGSILDRFGGKARAGGLLCSCLYSSFTSAGCLVSTLGFVSAVLGTCTNCQSYVSSCG